MKRSVIWTNWKKDNMLRVDVYSSAFFDGNKKVRAVDIKKRL